MQTKETHYKFPNHQPQKYNITNLKPVLLEFGTFEHWRQLKIPWKTITESFLFEKKKNAMLEH